MTQGMSTLVVTFDAYKFSTRSRKAAARYSECGPTVFLGTSGAGRAGRWDSPGSFYSDEINVRQIRLRRPRMRPSITNQLINLICTYLPGYIRLIVEAVRTPADVVHVTSAPLTLVGVAHKIRHRSAIVLDIQERPGVVAARGSLTSFFSVFESRVLRLASRLVTLATVVTEPDVQTVRALGFREVLLVRNAPLKVWRAAYVEPPKAMTLQLAVIGTIFEGRAYETLLHALAKAIESSSIHVRIYGPGRPDYVRQLQALSQSLGISASVEWMGAISSDLVSEAYLQSHVGLVLYEPVHAGNDGLSNKILECVATGRPVIASDLPENRRFVLKHGVGWLTGVNVESLSQALNIPKPDAALAELSSKCRGYGDDWLNWESEFAGVIEHVASAMDTSRRGSGGLQGERR